MTLRRTSEAYRAATGVLPLAALLTAALLVALGRLSPPMIAHESFTLDTVRIGVWAVVAGTIPLVRSLGARRMPALPFELPAAVFLALAAFSIVASNNRSVSANTWLRYAEFVVLAIAVSVVAADSSRRRYVYWSIVAVSSVTAIIAFVQLLFPTAQTEQFAISGVASVRVFSTFGNPDFYAEFLVVAVAVALLLCVLETGVGRALAVTATIVLGMALALTFTRGSWIALAVAIVIAAGIIEARFWWAVAGGVAVLLGLIPGVAARLDSITGTSNQPRWDLWKAAWQIIVAHPVFGVGIGRYLATIRGMYRHSLAVRALIAKPQTAHESYLLLAAETGILGGLAFVWLITEPVRAGIALAARASGDRRRLAETAFLTAAIVAFATNALTSNTFQHPQAAFFFWIVVGLQAGLGARLWAEDPVPTKTPNGPHALRAMRSAWAASSVRLALVRPPLCGGRLLWDSSFGRWLAGPGDAEASAKS